MFKEKPGMGAGSKVALCAIFIFMGAAVKAGSKSGSADGIAFMLIILLAGAGIIWFLTRGKEGYPLYDQFLRRIEKYAEEFSLDRDQTECLMEKAGSVLEEEITAPEKDAFLFTLDHFRKELTSGRNHMYKGELSPYGEVLLEAYARLISQGAEQGFVAKDMAGQDLDDLRAVIKTSG